MKTFFTIQDLQGVTLVPRDKIGALVAELNRITMFKVAGNSEQTWDKFVEEYGVPGESGYRGAGTAAGTHLNQ